VFLFGAVKRAFYKRVYLIRIKKEDKSLVHYKNKMILNPGKLLLIDGAGALLSAFLLGVVLVKFENIFGMPLKALCFLSTIACIFAAYSFTSYLLIKKNRKPYLKIIAFANLMYCCLTLGLIFYYNNELTNWGLLCFLCELAVIMILVIIELRSASTNSIPANSNLKYYYGR
jgi:hypothetical protein